MNKRSWFQIHLSTAIVLMFVAGVLVWANSRNELKESYFLTVTDWGNGRDIKFNKPRTQFIGWPLEVRTLQYDFIYAGQLPENLDPRISNLPIKELPDPPVVKPHRAKWDMRSVLVNLVTALAILTAVAVGCEWRVRRRSRA